MDDKIEKFMKKNNLKTMEEFKKYTEEHDIIQYI